MSWLPEVLSEAFFLHFMNFSLFLTYVIVMCGNFRFPFYYEIKILIVLWLMMPATRGSSVLYRKFVHPLLSQHEQDLDAYIERAKTDGYSVFKEFSGIGLQYLATFVVQATAALQTAAHRSTETLRGGPRASAIQGPPVKLTESQSEPVLPGMIKRTLTKSINMAGRSG